MYKIGIQERKEEKMIITLLKSFLAGAIGYIYALMVSMLVSYIISYIIFVFIWGENDGKRKNKKSIRYS